MYENGRDHFLPIPPLAQTRGYARCVQSLAACHTTGCRLWVRRWEVSWQYLPHLPWVHHVTVRRQGAEHLPPSTIAQRQACHSDGHTCGRGELSLLHHSFFFFLLVEGGDLPQHLCFFSSVLFINKIIEQIKENCLL